MTKEDVSSIKLLREYPAPEFFDNTDEPNFYNFIYFVVDESEQFSDRADYGVFTYQEMLKSQYPTQAQITDTVEILRRAQTGGSSVWWLEEYIETHDVQDQYDCKRRLIELPPDQKFYPFDHVGGANTYSATALTGKKLQSALQLMEAAKDYMEENEQLLGFSLRWNEIVKG